VRRPPSSRPAHRAAFKGIPDGAGKADGIAVGENAAAQVLARAANDGAPEFVEAPAPTGEALQPELQRTITRTMKLLDRRQCWSKSWVK
jgi:hypothetical protein